MISRGKTRPVFLRRVLIARKSRSEQRAFWINEFKKTEEAKQLRARYEDLISKESQNSREYFEKMNALLTIQYVESLKDFARRNGASEKVIRVFEQSIEDIEG